ncbi:Hypothetical predicted protein [Octopus vulgaris]|uniref:Uncharacterized protein n=1 Tax=Octopus vulgaris TaxID=6645 RepID=A0AA36AQ16_OCTVU|nr:Hypothetical predicted protein [Octopus vulgaris]
MEIMTMMMLMGVSLLFYGGLDDRIAVVDVVAAVTTVVLGIVVAVAVPADGNVIRDPWSHVVSGASISSFRCPREGQDPECSLAEGQKAEAKKPNGDYTERT